MTLQPTTQQASGAIEALLQSQALDQAMGAYEAGRSIGQQLTQSENATRFGYSGLIMGIVEGAARPLLHAVVQRAPGVQAIYTEDIEGELYELCCWDEVDKQLVQLPVGEDFYITYHNTPERCRRLLDLPADVSDETLRQLVYITQELSFLMRTAGMRELTRDIVQPTNTEEVAHAG